MNDLHVHVGSVVDQELQTGGAVSGRSGEVKRSEAFVVGLTDISAVVNQLTDHSVLPVKTGHVQGRVSKCVGLVYLEEIKRCYKDTDGRTDGRL